MTVALVTGGNRGIGYAVVKGLASRLQSLTIIIGCRDVEAGQEAIRELTSEGVTANLDVVKIDIEDDESILQAVAAVEEKYGHLDALVNNAAKVTYPASDSLSDIRAAANALYNNGITSHEIVTRGFLPLLRKSAAPRVVMMSSGRGSMGKTAARLLPPVKSPGYCVSKAALNMLTLQLQLEEESSKGAVKYWATNPGHCKTAFNGFNGRKDPADGAEPVVRLLAADEGQYEPGTFWQYEDGVFGELPW